MENTRDPTLGNLLDNKQKKGYAPSSKLEGIKKMSHPEYHDFDEFKNRFAKLNEIKDLQIEPYPHKFTPNTKAGELHVDFDDEDVGHSEDAASGATKEVVVAGRLVLFRAMGKNAFGQIQDDSGRIQIMFNRDLSKVHGLSEDAEIRPIKFIEKKLDLGDFIGIHGHIFKTQKGELTILAKVVTLLGKSLLPLPDKHAGLADKGTRYRKRWLDLISSSEVMNVFQMRSSIMRLTREHLHQEGYMEVETPILQNTYGGAEARPFTTHINALDQDMFLRISIEIGLKKLIIGGLSKIFEIGKVFRNEGIDKTHNPEFSMLELYAAYLDYNDIMCLTENLFAHIAKKLFGTTKIGKRLDKSGKEHEIDLKAPWKRMTMKDSIKTYADLTVEKMSDEEMKKHLLDKTGADPKKVNTAPRGILIAMLFEELVEEHLVQPHHIIDHPVETTPLCKWHRDPDEKEKGMVERFETFILGYEFTNAYTELNDPIVQRDLLEQQAVKKDAGDDEAHPMDEEFIEAMCQGMPPTGGLGIGMDRMTMLFTGVSSIRDILYFPIMKPEE